MTPTFWMTAQETEDELNRRKTFLTDVALNEARNQHRAHSLIGSQRTWQHLVSVNGVAAWGYAYENGQFTR